MSNGSVMDLTDTVVVITEEENSWAKRAFFLPPRRQE